MRNLHGLVTVTMGIGRIIDPVGVVPLFNMLGECIG